MRILLGVTGGIAAYKAALLLRSLTEAGHDVHVIPTQASLNFVGAATWEALSGHTAHTDVFTGAAGVEHVALGRSADLVIVAPATADLLARAATGAADDLLTTTLLTVTCPVLLAPAMHTEMWLHPATVANVATLRERGVHVLDPDSGRLTGADTGPGRLPEPEAIARAALGLVGAVEQDLEGVRAVVSAGGTREAIDPVRYLGNRSSGRQGVAVADALAARGAHVTVVAANVSAAVHGGRHDVVEVVSTADLAEAMTTHAAECDVVVMAAAVADYRPATGSEHKLKKTGNGLTLELVENPDILAGLVAARRPGQVIVGFAAETGDADSDPLEHGRAKAIRKGADLLAVNAVGHDRGFGDVPNALTVLDGAGELVGTSAGSKDEVAAALVSHIADLILRRSA